MKRNELFLSLIALVWIGTLFAFFIKMETPLGSIEGIVLAGENGKPIQGAEVSLSPEAWDFKRAYKAKTDEEGHFLLAGIPASKYFLYCQSSAHYLADERERYVQIKEGERKKIVLKLSRSETSISIWADKSVFHTGESVRVWASGYAPEEKLHLTLYRFKLEELPVAKLFELGKYIYPWRQPGTPAELSLPRELVKSWEENIKRDPEDTFNWGGKIPYLPPGLYILDASSGIVKSSLIFLVTSLALILKQDGEKILLWATDLEKGFPLEGVDIMVQRRNEIITGKTSSMGLWEGKYTGPCKIVGKIGPSYAFLAIWEYEYPRRGETSYRIYTYTERPIYRPGQTVYFKSIVRALRNEEYRLPHQLRLKYVVTDEEENILHISELRTNRLGSCWGSFKIPSTAKPGIYSINVSCKDVGAYDICYFNVSVYRKPEMEVKLKPNKERYLVGETAKVEVEANYLFGVPVSGATVDYEVYRSPYSPYFEEGSVIGEEENGEMVRMATTKTDNMGKATISLRLEREPGRMRDYIYSVNVTVTDTANRTAQASTNFLVTRSPSTLKLSLHRTILKVGEKMDAELSYSSPFKDRREIKVILYKIYWAGKKAKKKEQSLWRLHMKDGEKRKIQLMIGEEGEYELVAKEKDAILDTISLVALPSLVEGRYSLTRPLKHPRLLSDRRSYQMGDEALLLLDLPYKAVVLLTYEGRKLYKYEFKNLEKGRHLIRITNLKDYGYFLLVQATIVRKGKLLSESATLSINPPRFKLKLSLETDKKVYEPRSKVFCKVKIEDEKGQPLKGELSIAVVDEAIFKIMEEKADEDITSFFALRDTLEVITRWSGEMIYLGPVNKAFSPEEVRQYFPDTAFWLPSLLTDENGVASFSFRLPDTITSWRITAIANTFSSIFGANKLNIITQKPLFLRLVMPVFVRQGDTTTITGIVHNRTDEKQTVKLELSAENVRIKGDKQKELVIEAKKEGKVEWNIEVENEESATIQLYALAKSGLKDAMKLTIPILPFGLHKEESKSGQTDGTVLQKIRIDKNAIPSTVKLKINLSPSITSSLFNALDYLARYPYGCTEQTVDAFLPDIALYRFLKEKGIKSEKLEKELPDMISNGIFRLYYLQHTDGGWGWVKSDDTLPWTSAYALWGLWEANKMGFPVKLATLEQGKNALLRMMEEQVKVEVVPKLGHREKDQWLLAFYVLTGMGEDISPFLDYFFQIFPKLSPKGKALLTLSYLNLGKRDKAKEVFQSLWTDRQENGNICFWEGEYGGVEETALALRAMLKLQPQNFACVKAVNYILTLKRGDKWLSTKDTAQVILCLLEFSKIWEDLNPSFRVYLQVNGRTVKQFSFSSNDVFNPPLEINLDMKHLKPGENEIKLIKQGRGKLFYSLKLEEILKRNEIKPNRGLGGVEIKRVYRPLSVSAKEGLIWKAGRPSEEFRKGRFIEVEVRLKFRKSDIPRDYFIIEEPLPPGCEFNGISDDSELYDYDELGDKVAFYLPYITKNEEITLRYRLRTETEGVYRVMPTFLYNMYFPQYWSIGNSNKVKLK